MTETPRDSASPEVGRPPRRGRACTCLGCAGIAVVAIAVGIGAAVWTISTGAGHSLAAERAKVRQRGEPLSGAELNRPPVPDEQNAAVPLQAAANALVANATAESFEGMKGDDPATWPQGTVAALRQWVAANQQPLSLVREAARRPRCRFPVDYSAGPNTTFPQFADVRKLARLVRAAASVDVTDRRYEAAAGDIGTGLALGGCLDREPTLIGKLVQYAAYAIALHPAKALLREPGVSPEALATQQRALDRAAQLSSLRGALVGERALGLTGFELARQGKGFGGGAAAPGSAPQQRFPYPAFLLDGDAAFYLQQMQREIALADQPYYQAAAAAKRREAQFQEEARRFPPKVLSATMMPVYWRVGAKYHAACVAQLETARVATAVRLHYLRTGKLPQKLDQLTPKELSAVPVDPFSGQPLVYRIEAGGRSFRVYSLGENMKDDGGVERPRTAKATGAAQQVGPDDIVVVGVVR